MKLMLQIDGAWINPNDTTQPVRKIVRTVHFDELTNVTTNEINRLVNEMIKDYKFILDNNWKFYESN